MRIFVKVKTGTRENKVIPPHQKLWKGDEDVQEYFIVSVKELPKQGKANDAIIRLLARYFSVTLSQICLIRGSSSKLKVFEIKN